MHKFLGILPLVVLVEVASAQTIVNSTFTGAGGNLDYSNPSNWAPAEVPNNSAAKNYNVTAQYHVSLDIDATVSNLTALGSFLSEYGKTYIVTGNTTVEPPFGELFIQSGIFRINGALTNFDSATRTLTSGRYIIKDTLQFPDADIVNNGATLMFSHPGAVIIDGSGADGLRHFARNLESGLLTIADGDFTIPNRFTNNGTLQVSAGSLAGASLTMAGGLTNFDVQSNTLTDGVYDIATSTGSDGLPSPARLTVAGADIVRNSASIILEFTGGKSLGINPSFVDENGNNALRNLAENQPSGIFQLKYLPQPFATASDLTNFGTVDLYLSTLRVPPSHFYRQVGGYTEMRGGVIAGNVEILGGQFLAAYFYQSTGAVSNSIDGDLTVGTAIVDARALAVGGSAQVSDGTRLLLGPNDGLSVRSALNIAGTLELVGAASGVAVAHAGAISGEFKNAPNGSRVWSMDGTVSCVINYSNTDVTLSDCQSAVPTPRLPNLSTRAQVLTGDGVAIGGFIVSGSDSMNVVVRAIGPSLSPAGVTGALQDPVIELHDSKGAVIATNDDWQETQGLEISAIGLMPPDARESAIYITLPPGAYTAVLRGKNGTTGVALVEVYDLSRYSQSKLANISTRGFVDADHVLIGGLIPLQGNVNIVVRAIGQGLENRGVQNFLPDAALEVRDKNGVVIAANDDFATPASNQSAVPTELQPTSPTDAATGLTVAAGGSYFDQNRYTVIVSGKNGASGVALVEIYDLD